MYTKRTLKHFLAATLFFAYGLFISSPLAWADTTIIRINAGAESYTDSHGNVWSPYTGPTGYNYVTSAPIANTTEDTLYQSSHWDTGTMDFSYTVPNRTYEVTLKFAEQYFTQSGERVFNVDINGNRVLTDFDIIAQSGGSNTAIDKTFATTVTNGSILIHFASTVDDPQVNAIEIVSMDTSSSNTTASISAPTITIPAYASSSNATAFKMRITGDEGASVTYIISDGAHRIISTSTDSISGGFYDGTFNLSNFSFNQGLFTVSASLSLNGSISATTTATSTLDTIAPVFGTVSTFATTTSASSTTLSLPTPTTTDTIDPNPTVTNDAPSVFSLGTTTVTWTAKDAAGNSATTSQSVVVTSTVVSTTTATTTNSTNSNSNNSGGGNTSGGGAINTPAPISNGPIVGLLGSIHAVVAAPVLNPVVTPTVSNPQTSSPVLRLPGITISRTLKFGMRGDDVRELQAFLSRDPSVYPEGLATGYFGPLTRQAVIRFQLKYGIVSNAKFGGLVGPLTLSKLSELANEQFLSVQHSE